MGNELEELKKWGAHPSEAIARLLGDYTLYRQLIRDFCENNDVDLLHFRLEQKDYAAAFRVAHSMKGAAASLGLTPLTNALKKLAEDLRPFYEEENGDDREAAVPAEEMDLEKYLALTGDKILYHLHQVDHMWNEYCRVIV